MCLDFAYKVTNKTNGIYSKRNRYASKEKFIIDHFTGKLAECATHKHFKDNGFNVSDIDFIQRDYGDTGSDLTIPDKNINLNVKCVKHDANVKDSWLIQKKEVLKLTDKDYFVLCVFHEPTKIEIRKIIHHSKIQWKEPRHKSLNSKLACYLSDFKN